jgi:GT2 family glycosyltransferase
MRAEISVVVPIDPRRPTEIVKSIKAQRHKCVEILVTGNNAARNRNIGAKKAETEIIAFANMHSILAYDWSEKVIEFFKKHPEIDIVGGPHLSSEDESYFGKISGYALGSLFGAAEVSSRYNTRREMLDADEKYLTSANLVCKKKVLDEIKFDESLYPGEDPNFITSAKKAGFRIAYSPNIIVTQRRRDKLRDLSKQIFFYGTARPKKENFTTTLSMPSFLVPPLFVFYLALLPTLLLVHWLLALPFFTYIFLNFLFSIYEGLKNQDILAIFVLPFVFLTVHLSYGLGYLYGFIQKVNRK